MRVAVITGGSSGIGEACARELAKAGWHCVLVARGEERLQALAAELGCEYEVCDVGSREDVERVAAAITARHPKIGLLLNNAGVGARADFISAPPDRVESVTRTNYLGGVWALRAFLPALEADAPSHVVNLVSIAGIIAFPPSGPYTASKHAQLAFSRATAAQLRRRGVHVHAVLPGFVETPGFPQRGVLPAPLSWTVIDPPRVARAVLRAIRWNRGELLVPWWYRIVALFQGIAPGLVGRVLARGDYRPAA